MNRLITRQHLTTRFFEQITAWPKTIITLGFMLMLLFVTFLPDLYKDTRADAFIPPDHSALLFRDKTLTCLLVSRPFAPCKTCGAQ